MTETTIKVFSERGQTMTFATDQFDPECGKVTLTLGDLKQILLEKFKFSYDPDKTKVVNRDKTTLEDDVALLGTTKIYMYPKDTKAGELSRSDLYDLIKQHISLYGKEAEAHYNNPRNYTNLPTDVLREKVSSFSTSEGTVPASNEYSLEEAMRRIENLENQVDALRNILYTTVRNLNAMAEDCSFEFNEQVNEESLEEPDTVDPDMEEYLEIKRELGL